MFRFHVMFHHEMVCIRLKEKGPQRRTGREKKEGQISEHHFICFEHLPNISLNFLYNLTATHYFTLPWPFPPKKRLQFFAQNKYKYRFCVLRHFSLYQITFISCSPRKPSYSSLPLARTAQPPSALTAMTTQNVDWRTAFLSSTLPPMSRFLQ